MGLYVEIPNDCYWLRITNSKGCNATIYKLPMISRDDIRNETKFFNKKSRQVRGNPQRMDAEISEEKADMVQHK